MKKTPLLISLIFYFGILFGNSFAQNPIPNSGFESWNGNIPNGWSATANVPGFYEPITKSTDMYSGMYAVRGEVLNVGGNPYPPVLYTGSQTQQTFAVSENHSSFTGYYKFNPQGGDNLYIEIVFFNTTIGGGAEGNSVISSASSSYQLTEINMIYDDDNPPGWHPNMGNITVTILPPAGQTPHIGTWFLVDHFSFDGYPMDVDDISNGEVPAQFSLEQNFPNPFNPSTKIKFAVPEESHITVKIYNLNGEEVAALINENLSAGSYQVDWNAEEMPTGVYVYIINNQKQVLSNKMLLIK